MGRRALRAMVGLAVAGALGGSMVAASACGSRDEGVFGGSNPATTSGTGGSGGSGGSMPKPAHATKVDLLLVIDNSPGTDLKHQILANDLPALLETFTDPPCAASDGTWQAAQGGACPMGTTRIFPPSADLHLGVITSSLGGHGADTCLADKAPSENDKGHLIHRGSTDGMIPDVKTWNDKGFLVWDPNVTKPTHTPPGESNSMTFEAAAKAIAVGVGQAGCGFEATHESWYRFLADPNPYLTIAVDMMSQTAVLAGTDDALLAQRASFLRPDSLLVVMVLSDENDASIRDGSQYFFAAERYAPGTTKPYHLPKPRAACAKDPNDPCCRSCGQPAGAGCDSSQDGCIDAMGKVVALAQEDDPINLRAWDDKRRFGIDFLYPIGRYADALSQPTIADRNGNIVKNPIFSNLSGKSGATVRDERLVLFTAIVGVPWQDVARTRQDGTPDLVAGRDAKGHSVGGFMTGAELTANGRYGVILGDPAHYHTMASALPTDALMIESIEPRSGTSPIIKAALAPPTAAVDANPINGHERNIATKSDLQYTCIFDRPMTIDCVASQCDCTPGDHDPLCQAPMMGLDDAVQYRDKAYPGLRHIDIAKQLGQRAAIGSVCPARGANASLGYKPMSRTLGDLAAPLLK